MNYIIGLTIIGVITGLFAGLIGGGAEILIVPLLTAFGLLGSLKTRIGTSIFMLVPPIGLLAAIKFYKEGHVDIFAALWMALIFAIFASISAKHVVEVNTEKLRKLFGIFTICAGLYMYFKKETKK